MKSLLFGRGSVFIGLWDVVTIALSLWIAYLLRFDSLAPPQTVARFWVALGIALPVKLGVFYLTGLHRRWWRSVDVVDLYQVFVGNTAASLGFALGASALLGPGLPRSVYGIDFLVCVLLTTGTRFAGRLYNETVLRSRARAGGRGILVYGAGVAGTLLVREIQSSLRLNYRIIGFLDDDPNMRNTVLLGVPVLGTGRDAARIVDRYKNRDPRVEEIVIAMPSVVGRRSQMEAVLANCRAAGVPCKTVPSHEELLSGKVRIGEIRDPSTADLLGREPVRLDETRLRPGIAGRTVLVTGAAGSIGSELCLQVSDLGPRRLVAVDQSESGLFTIEREVRGKFPSLEMAAEIGDIRDARRIDDVIRRHAVDVVFHAAAYKHVPLMETNLLEAVKTNVLGTWNVVQAASRHRVSDFLMISTDKAVNPTSVMGATKRVAELLVSGMPGPEAGGSTKFVSVRFGNVLGSSGSVVPIFREQIAGGGPVTVTHPEARRYFMTVGEAVQLVIEASMMGKGSEIFVLDMGEPIRIMDLARNLIRLSGLVPDEDIEIRVVGLRPGERLAEELITAGEHILPTYHDKIKIFQGPRVQSDTLDAWVAELRPLVQAGHEVTLVAHLKRLVPEYRPSAAWAPPPAEDREPAPASLRPAQQH